jgi:RNA 2',3'-cyclic 3'-phosphodiesterase
MIRLFVGIAMPAGVRRLLSSLGSTIPGARAVPEEQIHLTLRFIGEVEANQFHDIRERLSEIDSRPLTTAIRGVGHFPPRGKPRIVWAGLESAGDIMILRNKVNYLLRLCGIEPERRKFHPHVTLARLKNSSPERVAAFLQTNALLQSPTIVIDRLTLYSSRLHPEGATHLVEAVYPLSAADR